MKKSEVVKVLTEAGAGDEKITQFLEFHQSRPEVWQGFVFATMEKIKENPSRVSAKLIWERLREYIPAHKNWSTYSLPNTWHSFYAHVFKARYPEVGKVFELRRLKSE